MTAASPEHRAPAALFLFSGMGGGALGFGRAGFRSVGAFDSDEQACADFEYITGWPAWVADLGEMTPDELRGACSARPDVVFLSPPCKAYSGCFPASRVKEPKYLALNSLAFRGVWLTLEAWSDSPPPLLLLENVPRIQTRGRKWLDAIGELLNAYGYTYRETTHDCGELGALAQRRRRFLLLARHKAQVPEFVYEPPKRPHKTIGEVLGALPVPLPGSTWGGPMHRLPRLSPMNWVRLAFIPAGGDWRDLPEAVALAPRRGRQNGGFGVNDWAAASHTVVAEGSVRNTWGSVVDPRFADPRMPVIEGPPPDLTSTSPCHIIIEAADGTWHRPLTTLELAVLQGFPAEVDGEWLKLAGNSHAGFRQRIGNAVPPPAAEAVATVMRETLDACRTRTFLMSVAMVWCGLRRSATGAA